jgi:hypothetical protein
MVYLWSFLFIFISCTNEPAMPTAEEAKAVVMEKITLAAEKWSKGEPTGYADCAAKDIVWLDELDALKPISGSAALKKYLANFKGQIPAHEFELLDPLFQVYDDIVIVTYRYQGIFEGEPGEPWKVTSVYRYIDGDWFSVHENWSEVKE